MKKEVNKNKTEKEKTEEEVKEQTNELEDSKDSKSKKKEGTDKTGLIVVVSIISFLVLVYLFIWPLLQSMIVQQTCNSYGEGYHAERCKIQGWKCTNGKDIIQADHSICIDHEGAGSAKPIIYLYPEEETKISVKLGYPNNITASYPKYINGWNVLAKPNGDLIDLDTNRKLYALYWEGLNKIEFPTNDGFIVKGEDITKFLEEKLEILGLNEREAEEFIVYWLPIMEKNEYNYVRFATQEEINKNMPIEFSKEPDTLIRVLMVFKGLDNPIEIEEQKLEKQVRKGFTVVEWGGVNLDKKFNIK